MLWERGFFGIQDFITTSIGRVVEGIDFGFSLSIDVRCLSWAQQMYLAWLLRSAWAVRDPLVTYIACSTRFWAPNRQKNPIIHYELKILSNIAHPILQNILHLILSIVFFWV